MSDRSSHFVHRLQTLPSALAGVSGPRRLLTLAAVLALLALTLLPTAGQAQTYETEDDARVPRNLLAQAEAGGVALRWLPPAEDAASVDGYEILRRRPNRDEPTLTTLVSDTGNADTTYFDATATESGVRYNYRVKAIRNGVRSDWSNYSTVVRPPSAPPPPPPLVSNLGQSASAPVGIFHQYAQGFRLGKHGQGYEISSVSIDLAAAPSSLTVSLWIGATPGYTFGGVVEYKLFDFTNPTSFKVGLNKFTAPAGAFAYHNVNHFIVLSGFGSSLSIRETTSDAEDPGGETGAILWNDTRVRALGSTGTWRQQKDADNNVIVEAPTWRGNVLRMAVEGSRRDSGILASTYGQPKGSGQEIISVGDHGGIEITLKEADLYIIHGLSLVGDNTSRNFKPFQNPFVLHDAPFSPLGTKRFSLTMTRAGPGINVWTAPQGAAVAGGCPTVTVTETVTDEDGNETEVETEEVRCRSYIFDYDIVTRLGFSDEVSEGRLFRWFPAGSGSEDTPTAPGVSIRDTLRGDIALGTPLMAVLGEPLYAMVQNLGQTDSGYVSLGGSVSKVLSQKFTTGPVPYRLRGIGINIEGSDDSNGNAQVPSGPSRVSVAVHIVSGGVIEAKLFDLVSPGEFVPGHSFFEAPPGTLLLPNTTYGMVWSYLGGTWHRLQRTSSTDEDSGAQPGFRIDDSLLVGDLLSTTGPHSSGDALEMALYGEATIAPMVSNLGQDDNGYVSLGGTNSKVLSQSFSFGSRTGPSQYRLRGIGINIEGSDDSDGNAQVPDGPSSVSVAMHFISAGDSPAGPKLFDLVSPDKFEPGHNFFEAPSGTLLERDRTYVVVWSHLGGTSHRLQRTSSNNEDSGALSGFRIGDAFRLGATRESTVADAGGNALEIALYGAAVGAQPSLDGSYQVNQRWFHLPDGMLAGDQFRLVFAGSYTDAMSGDIEYYNALVQEEAAYEGNHRIIRGVAPEFKAVVCTADVDARTNTEIRGTEGVPIHWLDGGWDDRPTLIANSYYEFYSGSWINSEWGAYSTGNSRYFHERRLVWTGCDDRGFTAADAAGAGIHMGSTSGMAAVGTPGDPRREFGPLGTQRGITDPVAAESDKRHLIYAISPRLHRRRQ